MKRSLSLCAAILCAVALIAASTTASAATVFFDDFSGPNGNLVGTTPDISTGNWTQTGTTATNPLQINSNAVAVGTTGQDAYAAYTTAVPNPAGVLMRTSADITVSAANAAGDYFLHVSDPAGTTTNFYQRLFARSSGAGFQLGLLDTSGTGSATTWGSTVLTLGTPYHVDVRWIFEAGTQNDDWTLEVDGAPYLSHSWTSTTVQEPLQLTAVNFRQGTTGNSPTVRVDNLEVAVIPEPSTFALLGVVGLLGLMRRRPTR